MFRPGRLLVPLAFALVCQTTCGEEPAPEVQETPPECQRQADCAKGGETLCSTGRCAVCESQKCAEISDSQGSAIGQALVTVWFKTLPKKLCSFSIRAYTNVRADGSPLTCMQLLSGQATPLTVGLNLVCEHYNNLSPSCMTTGAAPVWVPSVPAGLNRLVYLVGTTDKKGAGEPLGHACVEGLTIYPQQETSTAVDLIRYQ